MAPREDTTDMVILVLAAGESSRMGRAKQLLPWGDTTLLGHVLEQVLDVAIQRKYLLLGARAQRILEEVDVTGFIPLLNPDWELGMGSGIAFAIERIVEDFPEIKGVMIVLADQPGVHAGMLRDMLSTHALSGKDLTACAYREKAGVPAIISGPYIQALTTLEGDRGARKLFSENREELILYPTDQPISDIDDLQTYRELHMDHFGYAPQ
ncbi:nucleotidyltransferase family protein [Robertkochia flava]|uniref:nucleotidyltransferase family protein n=1 Tax=Robertkochia flava TaxID=3447986 RepID=UPI001CCF0D00|nr:nucleotidyltransferase family protein [Robertkochia marina]